MVEYEIKNAFPVFKKWQKWGIIAIVLLIILFLAKPFKIIETGFVGVKSRFGKYKMEELHAGINFMIPLVEKIQTFNVKVRALTYKEAYIGEEEGFSTIVKPTIKVLDQRGLPIGIELTLQYRPITDMSAEILANWGIDWQEKIISPAIRTIVRDVVGQFPAEQMPTKRGQVNLEINRGINQVINTQLQINGQKAITIIAVQLRNIQLPNEIQKKIEEVQEAKLEAQKTRYVVEKAQKQQEAKRIEAETKKIQKITAAKALAASILLEAKAQAQANKQIAKSITDNLLKWKKLEVSQKLNEAIKVNPKTTIFLDTPKSGNTHLWLNRNQLTK